MPASSLRWPVAFNQRTVTSILKKSHDPAMATSAKTLEAARRWDPDLPGEIARSFVDGRIILDVVTRQRGGPVDIYFVVRDREAGYRAAVPAIRKVLAESSLALDFHYMGPDEVAPEA